MSIVTRPAVHQRVNARTSNGSHYVLENGTLTVTRNSDHYLGAAEVRSDVFFLGLTANDQMVFSYNADAYGGVADIITSRLMPAGQDVGRLVIVSLRSDDAAKRDVRQDCKFCEFPDTTPSIYDTPESMDLHVVHQLGDLDPTDPEWDTKIHRLALSLARR